MAHRVSTSDAAGPVTKLHIDDPAVDADMVIVPHPDDPIKGEEFNTARLDTFISRLSDPVESIRYSGETDDDRISVHVSWTDKHHIRMSGHLSIAPDSVHDDVAELVFLALISR